MRKPTICLSFDDGRRDNFRVVRDILIPKGLEATFNITTGYVDGTLPQKEWPCLNQPMTLEEVTQIGRNELFEIAGHGDKHKNSKEDWYSGLRKLRLWLGDSYELKGIASPHCLVDEQEIKSREDWIRAVDVSYIRIGLPNQFSIFQRVCAKLARDFALCGLFCISAKKSIEKIGDKNIIYSVQVHKKNTVKQIKCLIEKARKEKKDIVLAFHSILKPNEDEYNSNFSWDYDSFEELCDYLVSEKEKGNINVLKTIKAYELGVNGYGT